MLFESGDGVGLGGEFTLEEFKVEKVLEVVEVDQILIHVTHRVIKRPRIVHNPTTRVPDILLNFSSVKSLELWQSFRDHCLLIVIRELM